MYKIDNFICTHKDIHGDNCITEFLLPNIVDLQPNFIGMKSGEIYDLGLVCGIIRIWDENILYNELAKVKSLEKINVAKKKEILKKYIFQIEKVKKESPNNSIVRINEDFNLEWVETKATFLKRTRPRPKKLLESIRTNYLQLAKMCLSDAEYLRFEKFASKLKDYDNHWEYGTTLNCVVEYLEENDIYLFMALDWKADIDDLKGKINFALKKNFNITIDLPNSNNYPDRASVSYDNVLCDFISSLNKMNFDISFIDTDSDEYVIMVHPINKKASISSAISGIGSKEVIFKCISEKSI